MARARLLKPGFFTNDKLAEIPMAGRMLFAGLWTLADREGRLPDRPLWIKGQLFPYENVKVEALLSALAEAGFIVRYGAGERYIQVVNFLRHQHPHKNEPASTIPDEQGQTTPYIGESEPDIGESPSDFGGSARAVSKSVSKSESVSKAKAEAESKSESEPEAPAGDATTPGHSPSGSFREPDLPTSDFELLRRHWKDHIGALTTDQSRALKEHHGEHSDWAWAAVNETIQAPAPSFRYYEAVMARCTKDQKPPSSLAASRR